MSSLEHVLILCSDERLARDVSEALAAPGRVTEQAENGEGALRILRKHSGADVVVVDAKVLETEGIDWISLLRQKMPRVEVLVLSERNDLEALVRWRGLGVYEVLSSPVQPDELRGTVDDIFETKRARADAVESTRGAVIRPIWGVSADIHGSMSASTCLATSRTPARGASRRERRGEMPTREHRGAGLTGAREPDTWVD
jgi:DNA-binding NtrC family response regulator